MLPLPQRKSTPKITMSTPSSDEKPTRDAILGMLEDAIRDLHHRTMGAESTTPEELQLKQVRTLGYLANQYRKLSHDTDLDAMTDELALLTEDDDR